MRIWGITIIKEAKINLNRCNITKKIVCMELKMLTRQNEKKREEKKREKRGEKDDSVTRHVTKSVVCYWHLLFESKQNSSVDDFLKAYLTNMEWESLFSAVIYKYKKWCSVNSYDSDNNILHNITRFFILFSYLSE